MVSKDEKLCDFVQRLKKDTNLALPNIEANDGSYLVGTGLYAQGIEHKLYMTFEQLRESGEFSRDGYTIQDTQTLPNGEDKVTRIELLIIIL